MDARCRIEMFGGLRVIQGDTVHTRFRTHKAASLLAYLALNLHQTHGRERLVDLFWPEMSLDVGRDNLSTALAQLRRQLEPVGVPAGSIFVADRQRVRLNTAAVSTDLDEFDRWIKESTGRELTEHRIEFLERAVALYQGELLPGNYEDWAVREQTRCQTVFLQTLYSLGRLQEEAGRYEAALISAQRATQADPYLEEAYQAQMRLHVRLKRPAAALQVYDEVAQRFQKELGVQPSALTRQWAQRIRQDPNASLLLREPTSSPPPTKSRAQAAPSSAKPAPAPTASETTPPRPTPTLPLPLTRFYGRRQEIARLLDLLQTPDVRLVTLLGPGGVGKTRLSIEVANQMKGLLEDRVWFVSLADLPDASLIPSALTHALRLPPSPQADPLDQIVEALDNAPCLLVLDNFEHLLQRAGVGKNETPERGGAALARLLLQRAPQLRCLVTSRQALRLGGEQEFALSPLALPGAERGVSLETLLANESVALYGDRARLARADFALTASNASAVVALCRRLEGIPLALEMAAAWAKTVTPARMLERLERQLDLLVSRRSDLPPRHQSLRATIEWSYGLLEPEWQRMFARLAVFRGGWSLEAAEAVLKEEGGRRKDEENASSIHPSSFLPHPLEALAELQERSLIVMQETAEAGAEPRYRMLEPLREFGLERMAEEGESEEVSRRHADYFLQAAEQRLPQLAGPEQVGAFAWFHAEEDNLRAALKWSQTVFGGEELEVRLALALHPFRDREGRYRETAQALQCAVERSAHLGVTPHRAQAAHRVGVALWICGEYATALQWTETSHQMFEALGDRKQMASALLNQANLLYYLGKFPEARCCYERALEIGRERNDPGLIATVLNNLGQLANNEQDVAWATACFEESLALRRKMRDRRGEGRVLLNMASLHADHGDRAVAEVLAEEALAVATETAEQRLLAYCGNVQAILFMEQGRLDEADRAQRQSLEAFHEIGERWGIALGFETFGVLAVARNEPERATRLYAAAQRTREEIGSALPPQQQEKMEQRIAAMRARLGETEFNAHWMAGRLFTEPQAVAYALASPPENG